LGHPNCLAFEIEKKEGGQGGEGKVAKRNYSGIDLFAVLWCVYRSFLRKAGGEGEKKKDPHPGDVHEFNFPNCALVCAVQTTARRLGNR